MTMSPARWARLKELFHAAVERPPEDRTAFLARMADDRELGQEVERLLAAHAAAGRFMEPSSAAPLPAQGGLSGQVVGHHRVGRRIGAGGMGEVYEAHDTNLGRTVAIKVVNARDADAQARLRREAQHAAGLNHPHICTVHEVGEWHDNAYVVMELVTGSSLADLIPAEGLPLEMALGYAAQIADALAYAHRQGVVHRDLKAANVVVTPEEQAKVLDFGLARRIGAVSGSGLPSHAAESPADGVAGTLPYMAPELLCGEPADARSDIWALGVLLYEMTCGRRPFPGPTQIDVVDAILLAGPHRLPAHVPSSVAAIIERTLAKDPRKRYQDAGEVRAALETTRAELQAGVAGEPKASDEGRRAGWAVGAVALASIALAVVWFTIGSGRDRAPVAIGASGRPAIAVMAFDNPGGSAELAWLSNGLPSMLLTGLAQTPGLDVVSLERLRETALQAGEASLDQLGSTAASDIARRAGAGAIVTGAFFGDGLDVRIDVRLEDLDTGRVLAAESVTGPEVFALVDELTASIGRGLEVTMAGSEAGLAGFMTGSLEAYRLYSEAVEALRHSRWDDARVLLQQVVAIDPEFTMAYHYLGHTRERADETGANDLYRQRVVEQMHRLPERLRLLVEAQLSRWPPDPDIERAELLYAKLIRRYPDEGEAYVGLITLYHGELFDHERALEIARAGVEALPNAPDMRNTLGYALLATGRYAEARAAFEDYALLSPREPNPHDSIGEAYLLMGDPSRAVESFRTALTIDPGFSGAKNLVWALAMLGDYDFALAEMRRLQGQMDERNISLARSLGAEAFLLSRIGRYGEAATRLEAALRLAGREGRHADIAELEALSGQLALEREDLVEAQAHLARAEAVIARLRPDLFEWITLDGTVVINLLAGVAAARAGDAAGAGGRLARMEDVYNRTDPAQRWWYHALEGEMHLAAGDLDAAAAAFEAGTPVVKLPYPQQLGRKAFLHPFRDGLARTRAARGDLSGSLEIYDALLTPGLDNPWTDVLEPRYLLERARLLDGTGNRTAAWSEYRRFLELWKDADEGRPELDEARRGAGEDGRRGVTLRRGPSAGYAAAQ